MRGDGLFDVVSVDAEVVDVEEQPDVGGQDVGAAAKRASDIVGRFQRVVRDSAADRFQDRGAARLGQRDRSLREAGQSQLVLLGGVHRRLTAAVERVEDRTSGGVGDAARDGDT
jgi:hypothetical protein